MMDCPILHLNLKRKWFDMVGVTKFEEYREIKPYWHRYFDHAITVKGRRYHCTDVVVCFSNGYHKNRPQKYFKIRYLRVGMGNPELGADPDKQYFVIGLGEQIEIAK